MRVFDIPTTDTELALHTELTALHTIRTHHLTRANSLLDEIIRKMQSGSVLVVDDDASDLHSVLTTNGYDTTVAPTSSLAITLAKSHQYDIIFLDWCIPGKSGLELYFDLRESNPNAVVVVTGGHHLLDTLSDKVKLDIYARLREPVDMDEVLQITKEHSNGWI